MNGIHEVTGSIPVSSTKQVDNLRETVDPLNGGFVYFVTNQAAVDDLLALLVSLRKQPVRARASHS